MKKVILVSIVFTIISVIAGYFMFEGNWPFLPFPLVAGLFMTLVQKEKVSYKFLDKLVLGSLIFGFLTMFFIICRMYFIASLFYGAEYPFLHYFNYTDFLTLSLVFAFISFMGGLVGIVFKGFYVLYFKKK
ncbi:hypothetical protein KKD19_06320 [Patescibacteria group bacterium]|nr:hypothetical protein [Patescibacteria group bacterium]MCG2693617.1 hypothetical protein [Candidatus Parcubacteria bacterium]